MAPATAASMLLPLRRAPSSAQGHSHVRYSSPDPEDRPGVDFDAPGRLDMRVLQELGVPRNGDFYVCGPTAFMSDLTAGLAAWGTAASRIHTESFGAGPSNTPGVAASPRRPPHLPAAPPPARDRWSCPENGGATAGTGTSAKSVDSFENSPCGSQM